MFERIAEIEARYQELEDKLGQPELARDPSKLRELTQELASLRELIGAYRDWKQVGAGIAENEELAGDPDPEIRELAKAELSALQVRRVELEGEIVKLLAPRDPRDQKSVVLEIRPGTGGEEASLFAGDLFRMYTRYAQGRGWSVEVLSLSEGDGGGIREVIASIGGAAVYGRLKYESGVHRVQRVPTTESQGRIHTSTATVAVLPEADTADIQIDEKDLRIDRFRAGGPGGQSVNTTDSAIRVTHIPTGLVVQCQDEKSQHKNKAKAIKVLRARLFDLEQQRIDSERAATRKGQIGTRRPRRADPHLQLSAEPRHRSPRRIHAAQARPRHRGRDRRADRRGEHEPRSRRAAGVEMSAEEWKLMDLVRWTADYFTPARRAVSAARRGAAARARARSAAHGPLPGLRSAGRGAGPRALPRAGAPPRQGALAGRLSDGRARVLVDAVPRHARRADPEARDRDAGARGGGPEAAAGRGARRRLGLRQRGARARASRRGDRGAGLLARRARDRASESRSASASPTG